jgi:hypothetical protein
MWGGAAARWASAPRVLLVQSRNACIGRSTRALSTGSGFKRPSLPLHKLVETGDADAVRLALGGGATCALSPWASLIMEGDGGQPETPAIDRGDPALAGTTALMLATRLGHTEVATALIDHGADVGRPGAWGLTPLMYAAVFGAEEVVTAILAKGVEASALHATDVHGGTALMHATSEQQHAIVAILREHLGNAETSPAAAAGNKAGGGGDDVGSGYSTKPMTASQLAAACAAAASTLPPLVLAVFETSKQAHGGTLAALSRAAAEGGGGQPGGAHPGDEGLYCGVVSGLPLFRSAARIPAAATEGSGPDDDAGWLTFAAPLHDTVRTHLPTPPPSRNQKHPQTMPVVTGVLRCASAAQHVMKVVVEERDGEPSECVAVLDAKSGLLLGSVRAAEEAEGVEGDGWHYRVASCGLVFVPAVAGEPRFMRGTNRYILPLGQSASYKE